MQTHTHPRMYAHTHTHIHTYTNTYTQTYTHTRVRTHTHTHTHTHAESSNPTLHAHHNYWSIAIPCCHWQHPTNIGVTIKQWLRLGSLPLSLVVSKASTFHCNITMPSLVFLQNLAAFSY